MSDRPNNLDTFHNTFIGILRTAAEPAGYFPLQPPPLIPAVHRHRRTPVTTPTSPLTRNLTEFSRRRRPSPWPARTTNTSITTTGAGSAAAVETVRCSTSAPPTWAAQWCPFPQILVYWVTAGWSWTGARDLLSVTTFPSTVWPQRPATIQIPACRCSTQTGVACRHRTTPPNLNRRKWTTPTRRRWQATRRCSPQIRPSPSLPRL